MPLFRPSSWPLGVRTACDLLAVALIPLLAATWLLSRQTTDALDERAREGRQLLAAVTATRLDQLLVDSEHMVADLAGDDRVSAFCAADPAERAALKPPVQARLERIVATNPDVASAFIIDSAGIGLASTNPKNVGQDLSFREYWKRAAAGEPHVSDLVVGKTSSRPGIYVSQPVRRDGRVVGVAVMKVQGERVGAIVASVKPAEDGIAVLVDRDGIILAHPDPATLYHSLGPIAADRLREIDPKVRYELDSIESIDQPELAATLTAATAPGSTLFRRDRDHVQWILGYAPMTRKDWLVGVAQPLAALHAPIDSLRRGQALLAALVAGMAGLYALVRARQIVRPVEDLTAAVERIAGGHLDTAVPAHGDNELGQLASTFGSMVPRLREGVDLRRSMAMAMEVQQSLLPTRTPSPEGMEIVARSRYCDETGGDYYDFIDVAEIGPNCTLIVVADVMGHGIAAALIMASARAALRSEAMGGCGTVSLASVLTRVNRVLAEDLRDGRFVTIALILLDGNAGLIRWACAGHDPSLVHDPATGRFTELEGGGLPLGIDRRERYEEFSRPMLQPGQVLLIATDGIWEARNAEGEQYGKLRMQAAMRDGASGAKAPYTGIAAAVADAIERDHARFCTPRRIEDDVTFVVVGALARG